MAEKARMKRTNQNQNQNQMQAEKCTIRETFIVQGSRLKVLYITLLFKHPFQGSVF
jgi:hypothetical protein